MITPLLPSVFTPAAIDSIAWELNPASCPPPMYYQSLEDLASIRSSNSGSNKNDNNNILADLGVLDHISELSSVSGRQQQSEEEHQKFYFGRIALALLLLGHGYTDECHNLVTPLSWHQDISFAHGPSLFNSVTPSVRAFASYTHSLVHRKEAFNVGEFGFVGFDNAEFWSKMVEVWTASN